MSQRRPANRRLLAICAVPLALILAVLLLMPTTSGARTIRYVDGGGDDSASGRSDAPWRTLAHAVRRARPGTVIVVRSGTYSGFALDHGGAPGRPIVIRGQPGAAPPVVRGALSSGNAVELRGASHVRLERLAVEGADRAFAAGVDVQRGHHVRLDGLDAHDNRSFGIEIADSSDVTVRGGSLSANETGVQVSRSRGVRVLGATIADNDRMVVDDPKPDNDRGANAVVVFDSPGPVLIAHNRMHGNRARSTDFGHDGGAVEIYGSSRVTVRHNRMWDNENVVETGASPGGECADNRFVDNVAYGGRGRTGPSLGLILRCARDMRVAGNALYDLDRFAFDLNADADRFGAPIDGLSVTGNCVRNLSSPVYSVDSALPDSVTVDHQLVSVDAGDVAWVAGRGRARSLGQFTEWTGLERHGRQADPGYRRPDGGDLASPSCQGMSAG